jgi:hypothetical protein
LPVLFSDDPFASIERLGHERRESIDIRFKARQINRRIREIRITGHLGHDGHTTADYIRIGYAAERFQGFDRLNLRHHLLPPFLFKVRTGSSGSESAEYRAHTM